MNVRNFWIDVDIDGRKTLLSGGPRAKDGEMSASLYIRKDGEVYRCCTIECEHNNGKNILTIYDSERNIVHEEAWNR